VAAPLTSELRDGVAVVRMDDGKANAISFAMLDALGAALDEAEKAAKAVVLLGRPDRFSGGFDLGVMNQGGEAMVRLVRGGGRLALRLYELPLPVVIGCTGHALAMGAVLLCAADLRLGAAGAYKIGLNEVAIGLALPVFAAELARERLAPTHLQRATGLAEIFAPDEAVAAGFLDATHPAAGLDDAALTAAARLAALPGHAHGPTKRSLRARALDTIRASLA
jgi:enoyl-CoA hydratase